MAKYYVQSGLFRGIVARENAHAAARWAVETVMNQQGMSEPEDLDMEIGLFRLGKSIAVSERGFKSKDRMLVPTSSAVLEWMLADQPNERL